METLFLNELKHMANKYYLSADTYQYISSSSVAIVPTGDLQQLTEVRHHLVQLNVHVPVYVVIENSLSTQYVSQA